MAKACLLLLSLWCSASFAAAVQTRTAMVDEPATTTATRSETVDELTTQIHDAGLKLKRLGKDFSKTLESATIVAFDELAWGVTHVVASHLQEPFKQEYQEYMASLSVEKQKLAGLGQAVGKTLQGSDTMLFELLKAEAAYQTTLAALLITGDTSYIKPLIDLYAKKTSLHDTLDETMHSVDMLGSLFGQTMHRFVSMLKGVPFAEFVSWTPAIWAGFSANEISEAKKVNHELSKLMDAELSDIKDLLVEKARLKEDLFKAEVREAAANGMAVPTTPLPLWKKLYWEAVKAAIAKDPSLTSSTSMTTTAAQ